MTAVDRLRARAAALLERHPRHVQALALCLGLAAPLTARPPVPLTAAAALAAAGLVAALPGERRAAAALLVAVLAGASWSSFRLEQLDHSRLEPLVGRSGRVLATVTGPVRHGAFTLRAPGRVRRVRLAAVEEDVLLELPQGRAPPQGSVIAGRGEIAAPRPPVGGFDEEAWLRRQGRHVVVRMRDWRVAGQRGGVAGLGDAFRRRLAAPLDAGLRGERRAVVAGIVYGDDAGLDPELRDAFRASGLYHLLAVSGQNVAFLAGGVIAAAWLLGVSRLVAEGAILATIAAYVLAVGWQPSVVRAGVAGALASLAWLLSRPRDRWYFLLVGAAVLSAWNPYSPLEPGFQLSFAAVAAIFVAVPRIERALEGYPVPRRLAEVIAVSAACGVATAPILWVQFGSVPTWTLLANGLAAPVVAPLLGLGLAAALLYPLVPPAGLALAWLDGWLAAYLAWCARWVAGLPLARLSSLAALAAAAAAALTVLALARAGSRERRRVVAVLAVGAVVVGWRLAPGSPPPPPTGLRISFLNVGQGDAALVQAPGAAVLIDEGPPEADVAGQLRALGVRRLSLAVLTHPQRDHIGGAAAVLRGLRVDAILDPRLPAGSGDERRALGAARLRHVPVVTARRGRAFTLGRLRLEVLWPDGPGPAGDDPNNRAVVLRVSYGEVDTLFTADAEGDVTTPLRPAPVEILKVAHHGSADPFLPALLAGIRPRVAVVSVGRRNDYGHPTASTMAALAAAPGLDVFRTDRQGRVTIESDGRRISVRTER